MAAERDDALSSPVHGGSVPAQAGTKGAPPRIRLNEINSRPHAQKLRKKMTNAEAILWSKLRRNQLNGLKFRRQHPVMAYVADFACIEARLIVEVDGPTHDAPRERHHDERRDALMRRAGWRVLRVANDDIYHNLFPTLDLISSCARCAPSVPDCVRDTSPVNGGGKSDHED